jgi:hypothetical protein
MKKLKLNNKQDCFLFIKELEGKDKNTINKAINSLDIMSIAVLLKYCVGVKLVERENAEKSI